MHRHDLDLMAALAEGSLEDEAAARAQAASCRRCREELEAQTLALQALRAVEPATLTVQESAALRRDVWTSLRSGEPEKERRAPWYAKWAYAATGLVVVAGMAALLSQGSFDDAADPLPLAEEEAGLATDSADEAEAPAIMADEPDEDMEMMEVPPPDFFASQAARLRQDGEGEAQASTLAERASAEACLEQAGLVDHVVVDEVADEDLTRYLVAVPSPGEIRADTPVSFVQAVDCLLMAVDG